MFRFFRPRFGHPAAKRSLRRFVFFTISAIFIVAVLAACAPTESLDTWKMSPPTIETTSPRGLRLVFRAGDFGRTMSSEVTVFDETSTMTFSPQDRGVDLTVISRCNTEDGVVARLTTNQMFELKTKMSVAESVSLLALLPPQILSPLGLKKSWNCGFDLSAVNQHGSRSEGSFRNLKIQNAQAMERAKAAVNVVSKSASGVVRRRLACPQWWAEVVGATENATDNLEAMSRAVTVHGIDSRAWDRRPLCSVLETRTEGVKETTVIAGTFQPTYKAPRFSWTREFLLPRGKYENLMNRPVMAWTIRNEESTSQTVFISSTDADLRMSTRLHYNGVLSWTRPLRAQPVFTQTGGLESRTTSRGFYVRIAARSSATVVLHSGRGPYIIAMAEFGLPNGTTHLMLSTKKPITLESLGNESDVTSLKNLTDDELDAQPKDLGREIQTALIDTAVLASSPSHAALVETAMSKAEALAMGPSVDGAIVINLTPDENYREVMD